MAPLSSLSEPDRKKQKVDLATSDDLERQQYSTESFGTKCLSKENVAALKECLNLLGMVPEPKSNFKLPATLDNEKLAKVKFQGAKSDTSYLKNVFDNHGFRTSIVTSPRQALSVYKDSCIISTNKNEMDDLVLRGKLFLLSILGCHPFQKEIDLFYSTSVKPLYCLLCFCRRIRLTCYKAFEDSNYSKDLSTLIESFEIKCRDIASTSKQSVNKGLQKLLTVIPTVNEQLGKIKLLILKADSRIRGEQLNKEYERISCMNSSFSNAMMQMFQSSFNFCIKDIAFKRSHLSKYERISIYFFDPDVDYYKPTSFSFLPSLNIALGIDGVDRLLSSTIKTFWNNLLRNGYFATDNVRTQITPELKKFILSGIHNQANTPLQL